MIGSQPFYSMFMDTDLMPMLTEHWSLFSEQLAS